MPQYISQSWDPQQNTPVYQIGDLRFTQADMDTLPRSMYGQDAGASVVNNFGGSTYYLDKMTDFQKKVFDAMKILFATKAGANTGYVMSGSTPTKPVTTTPEQTTSGASPQYVYDASKGGYVSAPTTPTSTATPSTTTPTSGTVRMASTGGSDFTPTGPVYLKDPSSGKVVPFTSTTATDYKMYLNAGYTPSTATGGVLTWNGTSSPAPTAGGNYQQPGLGSATMPGSDTGTSSISGSSAIQYVNSLYQKYFGRNAYVTGSLDANKQVVTPERDEIAYWSKPENINGLDNFLQTDYKNITGTDWTPPADQAPYAADSNNPDLITIGNVTFDMTGWEDFKKAEFQVLAEMFKQYQNTGKQVNPDIIITQDIKDKFLATAKDEFKDYYDQKLRLAQFDLGKQVQSVKDLYGEDIRKINLDYGKNLENTQVNMARRGLEFSSERDKAEQLLADEAAHNIELAAKNAEARALEYGSKTERAIGTEKLPSYDWSVSSGYTPIVRKPGVYGLSSADTTRSLWSPMGGVLGTNQTEQKTAERNFYNDLITAEREKRSLSYL